MRRSITALLCAALIFCVGLMPAQAFEISELGFKMALGPSWQEDYQGHRKDDFADLGGALEVKFKLRDGQGTSTAFLNVVKADLTKYKDANDWFNKQVIGKGSPNNFLAWYSDYTYTYKKISNSDVVLGSGHKAVLTRFVDLNINGYYPNVAFVTFSSPDNKRWFSVVIYNDRRGIESIDDRITAVLGSISFGAKVAVAE